MSFREASAWITLVSVLACFGSYYGALAFGLFDPFSMMSFHFGVASILGLLVLQIGLRIVATLVDPKAALTPRDEREEMIEARSHTLGYYTMMAGMLAVVVITHAPGTNFMTTVYLGVLTMAVSAVIIALAQIIMFRRGA